MGPRLFCAEIPGGCDLRGSIHPHMRGDNCNRHSGPRAASMGPRLFRRGNFDCFFHLSPFAHASMGPRLFRRGNRRSARSPPSSPRSFNGATSFQTWKFQKRFSCTGHLLASMGPRLFRRGNFYLAWNPDVGTVASMGPRLFRRGNNGNG